MPYGVEDNVRLEKRISLYNVTRTHLGCEPELEAVCVVAPAGIGNVAVAEAVNIDALVGAATRVSLMAM
jgi:hypothetical protein